MWVYLCVYKTHESIRLDCLAFDLKYKNETLHWIQVAKWYVI